MEKSHPTLGCCGLDCGLCPRFHTAGASRCPGCGGPGFAQKHPACGFHSCCFKNKGLEACALCAEYPCPRFDREDGSRDSFVTHRRVRDNQQAIREDGLEAFLLRQRGRMAFLEAALARHGDGRSKGLYCLAAALLSAGGLDGALRAADGGADLKALLAALAAAEGEALKLRK